MQFDALFDHIGAFGRYQQLMVGLLFLMAGWPSASITIVFTLIDLPHWCRLPEWMDQINVQDTDVNVREQLKEIVIPWDQSEGQFSECEMYNVSALLPQDRTAVSSEWMLNKSSADTLVHYLNDSISSTNAEPVACLDWEFDHSEYGRTAVDSFNLVCGRKWLSPLSNTVYLLGMLVGSFISGQISDRIGRKPTLFLSMLLNSFCWILAIFAPNYYVFATARFLVGATRISFYIAAFILAMELVGPDWRMTLGMAFKGAYAIGYMAAPGIAFWMKDHVNYELVIVVPTFLFLFFYLVMPESPRWLLVNEKFDEAQALLEKVGKYNKKPLPEYIKASGVKFEKFGDGKRNLNDILRLPNLRKRTFVLYYHWMTITLLYYAIALNSGTLLPGNIYLNTFFLAAMEIPGTILGTVMCNWPRLGRRLSSFLLLVLGGLCSFITIPLIIYEFDTATRVTGILGKVFVAASFNTMYVYTAELFPTEVRHIGFGSCSMMARVSGLASSFVGGQLSDVWGPLPYLIFGVIGTTSGVLDLYLPETLNRKLCETLEEAEKFTRYASEDENAETHETNEINEGYGVDTLRLPGNAELDGVKKYTWDRINEGYEPDKL